MKREINLFRMSFRRFCDGSDVLAGSSRGKQAFSELCLETVAPTASSVEFSGYCLWTLLD